MWVSQQCPEGKHRALLCQELPQGTSPARSRGARPGLFPCCWKPCWAPTSEEAGTEVLRSPKSQDKMQSQRRIQSYYFAIFQGIFQSPPSDPGKITQLWIKSSASS